MTGRSPSTAGPSLSSISSSGAGYPCGYYLPSTVAPIGLAHGLPVGIQIIGHQYDDLTCLHMAGLIEEATTASRRRQGIEVTGSDDPAPRV